MFKDFVVTVSKAVVMFVVLSVLSIGMCAFRDWTIGEDFDVHETLMDGWASEEFFGEE